MGAFTVKQYVEENIRATNPLNVQIWRFWKRKSHQKAGDFDLKPENFQKCVQWKWNGWLYVVWLHSLAAFFWHCHNIRNRDDLETLSGAFWVLGLNCQYIRESNSLRELEERLSILFLRTMLNSLSSPAWICWLYWPWDLEAKGWADTQNNQRLKVGWPWVFLGIVWVNVFVFSWIVVNVSPPKWDLHVFFNQAVH